MSEHICICQFINIMFIITTCSPSSFDLTKKLTQWFSDFETLYPYDNQWRKPSMWPFENSFNAHFTLINCNVFLRFYLTCHVFLICQYFDNDVARTSEIYTYPLKMISSITLPRRPAVKLAPCVARWLGVGYNRTCMR